MVLLFGNREVYITFALALVKLAHSAELDEIVGDTAEVFLNKVLLDGFEESICSRMQKHLFKSDRGALSAKDERETLLTTRSSSEKFIL